MMMPKFYENILLINYVISYGTQFLPQAKFQIETPTDQIA
jgi:hypothetical protein